LANDTAFIGTTTAIALGVGAAALTVLAQFGAPWAVWAGVIGFCALWLTAALALSDGASRGFLAVTLRKSTYTQIYTTLTRRLVTRIWDALCDPVEKDAPVRRLFTGALTWRMYDTALLIAVAYPVLLPVGQWLVTGATAQIGSLVFLDVAPFWWDRAIVLCCFAGLSLGVMGRKMAAASRHRVLRQAADWLPILAFLFAFAGAFAISGTVAVSVVVTFTGAFAVPGAVSVVVAVVMAFAGAVVVVVAIAGALAGAVVWLDAHRRPRLARLLITLMVALLVPALLLWLDFSAVSEEQRSLFVFLGVLPLLNALYDTVSYAVTLSLMKRGLRSAAPWLWGLLDLVLACLLFLALGMTLVVVLHGLNELAGVPLVDFPALFAGVREAPGDYVWLYLMLFSTILPTAAHAGLSLLGVQGLWPRGPRRVVAGWVDAAPASPLAAIRAGLALAGVWAVPLLGLSAVIWGLWVLGGGAVLSVLGWYFDALLWLAAIPVGAI
jgi:hypothetical protein